MIVSYERMCSPNGTYFPGSVSLVVMVSFMLGSVHASIAHTPPPGYTSTWLFVVWLHRTGLIGISLLGIMTGFVLSNICVSMLVTLFLGYTGT